MFRATVARAGKWKDNLYSEDKIYGDFHKLKDAIEWVTEESTEFRGGWAIVMITIVEKEVEQ